ncbi:MAG: SoxXA-binding protein [Gammaproteobacteria bacterium]|nr:SoxXA-binding protein [Gammaproteobacteria bacterium]
MKRSLKTLLLAATFAICSGAGLATVNAADMSPEAAIAAAKEAKKQAASVGGEWRDTGKMIKKAEALLKAGKTDEATKMAEKAEAQGMLGYMQATSQTADKLHI